ncbi:MAG: hypothetical protein KC593_12380 [Myxococcales bacterium]|nr:hypothetical protein [Myxococcales bacterium]MCB9628836.1 hypothetical protein [Sandaracinaceae bacterium]
MRIFLSLLLTAGAVFGIGGGLARLHHGGRHHREHMMARVAETCVEAARELDRRDGAPHARPGAAPWGPPPHGPAAHGVGAPQPIFVPYPVPMPMPMPVPTPGVQPGFPPGRPAADTTPPSAPPPAPAP